MRRALLALGLALLVALAAVLLLRARRDGAAVTPDLVLNAEVPSVSGRLLDEHARPLADVEFEWIVHDASCDDLQHVWCAARTDAAGSFEFEVSRLEVDQKASAMELELFLASRDASAELSARKPFPTTLAAGPNALGDFQLTPRPILAAGRVVDALGAPVGDAIVRVALQELAPEPRQSFVLDRELRHVARSEPDGSFALRGRFDGFKVFLFAAKSLARSDLVEVEHGESDVELRVTPDGALEGAVRVDASIEAEELSLELARQDGIDSHRAYSQVEPDGQFAFTGQRPGDYTLELRHRVLSAPLARVRNVRIDAGRTARDARLDPLDLSRSLRRIALAVSDELGGALDSDVWLVIHDRARTDAVWLDGGKVHLYLDGRAADLTVFALGYLPLELHGMDADRAVALRRGPRLRFRLAPGIRLPEPPFSLGVRLERAGDQGQPEHWCFDQPSFDADGTALCKGTSFGPARVVLTLSSEFVAIPEFVDLPDSEPTRIEIRDTPGEQLFELRFSAEQVQAAVRLLAQY